MGRIRKFQQRKIAKSYSEIIMAEIPSLQTAFESFTAGFAEPPADERERALIRAMLVFSLPIHPHTTETMRFLLDQQPNVLIKTLNGTPDAAQEITIFKNDTKAATNDTIRSVKAKFQGSGFIKRAARPDK